MNIGDKVIITVNNRLCNGIIERIHGDYFRIDIGDRCELVHKSNVICRIKSNEHAYYPFRMLFWCLVLFLQK